MGVFGVGEVGVSGNGGPCGGGGMAFGGRVSLRVEGFKGSGAGGGCRLASNFR